MAGKRSYKHIARFYDLLDLPFEYWRYRTIRGVVFEGVAGTVLDAGVGTGRNMSFYPAGARVTGIDLSPQMLARAARRRARLGVDVELRQMDVTATEFPDGCFDVVVATFLFCVLDHADQQPALEELRRITKPGGEIRILEYAYSKHPLKRLIMRLWAPLVRRLYGAAFDRETEKYIPAAGLELVEQRYLYQDIITLLVARPLMSR